MKYTYYGELVKSRSIPRPAYKQELATQKTYFARLLAAVTLLFILALLYAAGSTRKVAALTAEVDRLESREQAHVKLAADYQALYTSADLARFTPPQTVEDQIRFVFGDKADEALKVARCESGLNPTITNKVSSATGLFQVLSVTHGVSKTYLKDSFINVLIAKKLYDASGWTPWVSSNHCHHLVH